MKKRLLRILLALACVSVAHTAHATTITNLDSIPYDLIIQETGEERSISIEPNATWSSNAHPLRVQIGKRFALMEKDGHYAIWKGGSITLQRLGNQSHPR